jgi:hypothetical protein
VTTRLERPVTRRIETPSRDLVVTMTANGLELREAGRRTSYLLPWGVAFVRAASLSVQAERAAKRHAKKTNRGLLGLMRQTEL